MKEQNGWEEERLSTPILLQQESQSKPSGVGWVVRCMGKRNVCEVLVVEVQAMKSASEATCTILRIDDLMAFSKLLQKLVQINKTMSIHLEVFGSVPKKVAHVLRCF